MLATAGAERETYNMQFEETPDGSHKYRFTFQEELDEPETVGATYRELVHQMVLDGDIDKIGPGHRQFAEWYGGLDQAMLTDAPLAIAELFEAFSNRSKEVAAGIASKMPEAVFESDLIAKRLRLGDKALQLAGLIRLEYSAEELGRQLDEHRGEWSVKSNKDASKPAVEE